MSILTILLEVLSMFDRSFAVSGFIELFKHILSIPEPIIDNNSAENQRYIVYIL